MLPDGALSIREAASFFEEKPACIMQAGMRLLINERRCMWKRVRRYYSSSAAI